MSTLFYPCTDTHHETQKTPTCTVQTITDMITMKNKKLSSTEDFSFQNISIMHFLTSFTMKLSTKLTGGINH